MKEILESLNSYPAVAYGNVMFADVEYDGTFFINDNIDNDWVGVIFSYQVFTFY